MWTIYEKKTLMKGMGKIPLRIRKHYELWKRIVELEGPGGLLKIKGLHDEALAGKWKGFRSSRLNLQWHIIYKVEKEECEVYVVEINPHKY